jgi:hypothetical protein
LTALQEAQYLRCAHPAVLAAYDKYASGRGISRALILNFLRRRPTRTLYEWVNIDETVKSGLPRFAAKHLNIGNGPKA